MFLFQIDLRDNLKEKLLKYQKTYFFIIFSFGILGRSLVEILVNRKACYKFDEIKAGKERKSPCQSTNKWRAKYYPLFTFSPSSNVTHLPWNQKCTSATFIYSRNAVDIVYLSIISKLSPGCINFRTVFFCEEYSLCIGIFFFKLVKFSDDHVK